MTACNKAFVLFCLAFAVLTNSLSAQSPNLVSLHDRVLTAARIYHQISTFFPDLSSKQFDHDYGEYLAEILGPSDDRRSFDLATMALVATLHDGHTWFYDDWLDTNYGPAPAFAAYPMDGKWVVVRSALASLHVGDVIETIEGTPTQQYFERSRKYISASSNRDAGVSFFDTPVLFPERFALTLDGGRQVSIDRKNDKKQDQPAKTEGRRLVPGSVGYIKVPNFRGIETQAVALDYLKQFHDAKAIILDVRGNPGLGDPSPLQQSLMDKPYPMWAEHSSMSGGLLLRQHGAYPELAQVSTSQVTIAPRGPLYTGTLFLLIDRGCVCACEAFVMPFKISGRARLLGETTAGTYSSTNFTQFENGMVLNVAAVRHVFPDGSKFEGVGIAPDIEIHPAIQDLKAGKDVVLDRALSVATQK